MSAVSRARPVPRQPLLYTVLAFSFGIVIGTHVWRPATWWLIAALAFLGAAIYFSRRRRLLSRAVALLAWTALGALSIQLRPETPVPPIEGFLDGNEVIVTGHVVREGNLRQAGFGGLQQSLDITTHQICTAAGSTDVSFGLRFNVYARESKPATHTENASDVPVRTFLYGERLRFHTKLHWPRNYRNPGAFHYVAYLADRGIVAQGSTKFDGIEVLPGRAGTPAAGGRGSIVAS